MCAGACVRVHLLWVVCVGTCVFVVYVVVVVYDVVVVVVVTVQLNARKAHGTLTPQTTNRLGMAETQSRAQQQRQGKYVCGYMCVCYIFLCGYTCV